MATTKTYKIELKNMLEPSSSYHFTLENDFFDMIDAPETRKGKLEVDLLVKKRAGHFVLDFHTKGHITITCDRCLDDMELPIDTTDSLQVKLGAGFADEGDIIVVPEEDGTINVAWFIYEFIALNIPIKHVHEQGKCNKGMMQSLKKHLRTESADEEVFFEDDIEEYSVADSESGEGEMTTDPRWDGLKKILNNN